MHSFLKNNIGILVIILAFITLQIFSPSFQDDLWWDSAVYLEMGKHMFSAGAIGLWEESRPLVLPALLGLFWKAGLDPILFGKLLSLIFSVGVIVLVYLISQSIWKRKTISLLAAILIGFFSTFLFFGSKILTEIPSTLFLLASIYFLLKNQYKLSGFLLSIALLTRFFQVFAVIGVVLYFIYKKTKRKELIHFFSYFGIPIFLFLFLNIVLYGDPILPFTEQLYLTLNTGEVYTHPFFFYFAEILKQNFLLLFFIPGLSLGKKEKRSYVLIFVLLFSFIPYLLADHKEMRLLIPAFALMALFASYFLYDLAKKYKFSTIILSIIIGFSIGVGIFSISNQPYNDNLGFFYDFMSENSNKFGTIWISSPKFLVYSNEKASELIYYPRYGSEKIDFISNKITEADLVMINSCDLLPCQEKDTMCQNKHEEFLEKLENSFTTKKESKNNCNYYIFSK